jgi:hypothetical protein
VCTSDADCGADTPICVQFDTGSMCSTSCGDDFDCPNPDAGSSSSFCAIPFDIYFCFVDCSVGGDCPVGTICYEQSNGQGVCL